MAASSVIIAPSILAADFSKLQSEMDSIASADWVQIDVMDGHFVPNLSFGAPVVKCLKTKLLIDVHLMVTNPAERVSEFVAAGAKHITFHAEVVKTTTERRALINAIHATGCTAGIALNPDTPVTAIDDVVHDVDMVLIMSVNPGFGGQAFIPSALEKAKALRKAHPKLMLQIDGGIDATTAALARAAGVNNLVAGSSVFKAADRAAAILALRG